MALVGEQTVIQSELESGSKSAEREMWPEEGDCTCGEHSP